MKLRVAIAEDQEDELAELAEYFNRTGKEESWELEEYHSGEELLAHFSRGKYDLILLDIQMKEMDGLQTAQEIRKTDPLVMLIFVTNLVHYAVQGYSVHAYDFWVKPVTFEMFSGKIKAALSVLNHRKNRTYSFRTVSDGYVQLGREDIRYVEIVARKLFLHTREKAYQCNLSMQEMESQLEGDFFFRCHAAVLINLSAVREVGKSEVKIDETYLPVSKHRRRELMNALSEYMNREGY